MSAEADDAAMAMLRSDLNAAPRRVAERILIDARRIDTDYVARLLASAASRARLGLDETSADRLRGALRSALERRGEQ